MPIIKQKPRTMEDGTNIISYTDSVGPNYVTYTFEKNQECLIIRNKGIKPILYSVGTTVDVTLKPGEEHQIDTIFNSFKVKSSAGIQAFEIRADEEGTVGISPGLAQEVNKLSSQLAQNVMDITRRGIDVTKFDAVADWVSASNTGTNNRTMFQNAALEAKNKNVPLIIPYGTFYVQGTVDVYTDIICFGKIARSTDDISPVFNIKPTKDAVQLDETTLTNLTRGSLSIGGLTGYRGGTLILRSTEELIKRYNKDLEGNYTAPYYKQEASLITDDSGSITPALDCTYSDLTKLTATIQPAENHIKINVLPIVLFGETSTIMNNGVVLINRSNVTIEGLDIVKQGLGMPSTLVSVKNAVNVVFNQANLTGAQYAGLGYGVTLDTSSLVSFNDCHIHDCRHAITGLNVKEVRVNRGSYSDIVDCHWGNDFIVDGAVIHGSSIGSVSYSGTDISVINSTIYAEYSVVNIRIDTPEMIGKIKIENNTIISSKEYLDIVYYASGTETTYSDFDFERELQTPDLISIEDNLIDLPEASLIRYLRMSKGLNFAHKPVKKLTVEGNKTLNKNRKTIEIWKDNTYGLIPSVNPIINVRNEEMYGGGGGSLSNGNLNLIEKGEENTTWGYDISYDRCGIVSFNADATTIHSLSVKNCTVLRFFFVNAKTGRLGDVTFDNCLFDSALLSGGNYFNFYNSVFRGAMSSSTTSGFSNIDQRIKRSYGNVAEIGCTNYPTNLNNYKNTEFYIA